MKLKKTACLLAAVLLAICLTACGARREEGEVTATFVRWDKEGITVLSDDNEIVTYKHSEKDGYRLHTSLKVGDTVTFTVKDKKADYIQRASYPEIYKAVWHQPGVIVSGDTKTLVLEIYDGTHRTYTVADDAVEDLLVGYTPTAGHYVEFAEQNGEIAAIRYWYDVQPVMF